MNIKQNKPSDIRKHEPLSHLQDKIVFMKPWDEMNLKGADLLKKLEGPSKSIENYWEAKMNDIDPKWIISETEKVKIDQLDLVFDEYRKSINNSFLYLPKILEYFALIRPIKVYIEDLDTCVSLSIKDGLKLYAGIDDLDLQIKSIVLRFLLGREYGWTSVVVNARFRTLGKSSLKALNRFFYFQELYRDGLTVKNPLAFINRAIKVSLKLIFKRANYF